MIPDIHKDTCFETLVYDNSRLPLSKYIYNEAKNDNSQSAESMIERREKVLVIANKAKEV